MSDYKLSKSTFLKGLQCEKLLYLHKYHYNLKDPLDETQKSKFLQGNLVGKLAQNLFPKGKDASPENHLRIIDSVEITKEFLRNDIEIIYEATFLYDDIIAALDILVKDEEGWKAFEVKSSTSVKDIHITDAAVQYYTITNSGLKLKDISIIHINNEYERRDDLDLNKLFKIVSVKDKVIEYLPKIPLEVKRFKDVLSSNQRPSIDIGLHCDKPYQCDYKGLCWKDVPKKSVLEFPGMNFKKRFELYNSGYQKIETLKPEDVSLSDKQWKVVETLKKGRLEINHGKIRSFINELKYPLYFLDFETFQCAVPLFNNTKPFKQEVFQYSIHIEDFEGSKLRHKDFLAEPIGDPRENFVKRLIKDCGEEGDIIVYNISFERKRLEELKKVFNAYESDIENIIKRLKDLMIPFQKGWYRIPELMGKYTIKQVLPALVSNYSYEGLDIKEGNQASNIFAMKMINNFDGDWVSVKKSLREYCKLDTEAMVHILHKLQSSL